MGLRAGRRRRKAPEFSIISHPGNFVKSFCEKSCTNSNPETCATLPIDFCAWLWYTISVPRGTGQGSRDNGDRPLSQTRDAKKKSKKSLDKPLNLWYNKSVKRTENQTAGRRKKIQKNLKNLLTNATKCGIIKTQKGKENPQHQKGIDTMANKVTKKDNFNALLALEQVQANPALVAFIEHELELLAKKAAAPSKPTVRQAENAEIKTAIVAALAPNKWYRCAEIKSLVDALASGEGTQRTARLCNDLVSEGSLVKTIDKKVVYFALAE